MGRGKLGETRMLFGQCEKCRGLKEQTRTTTELRRFLRYLSAQGVWNTREARAVRLELLVLSTEEHDFARSTIRTAHRVLVELPTAAARAGRVLSTPWSWWRLLSRSRPGRWLPRKDGRSVRPQG